METTTQQKTERSAHFSAILSVITLIMFLIGCQLYRHERSERLRTEARLQEALKSEKWWKDHAFQAQAQATKSQDQTEAVLKEWGKGVAAQKRAIADLAEARQDAKEWKALALDAQSMAATAQANVWEMKKISDVWRERAENAVAAKGRE